MSVQKCTVDAVEVDQHAALRAAVQMGIDDMAAGRFEGVDDVDAWMQGIVDRSATKDAELDQHAAPQSSEIRLEAEHFDAFAALLTGPARSIDGLYDLMSRPSVFLD